MPAEPINLDSVFNYIVSALVLVYNFMSTVLVFQIGGYTFNALQFALGAVTIRFSIHALFGSDDEGETEITLYGD